MLLTMSKDVLNWGTRKVATLKQRHRGNWHWMAEKSVPVASLNRSLWRSAESSYNYYLLLLLSGAIATFGLLASSSATVIGAMIVAPLMGPITSIGFAMVMANRRLLKRASLSLFLGALLTVGTAAVLSYLVGIDELTPEIVARTKPTLLDLGVALAAGAAGALAKSRRGISDALPGVAIAVALVPPLSVVGIGIAFASQPVFFGSLLLFLTNLVGIIFSSGLVFLALRYGSLRRAKRGLLIAITTLLCLGVPLSISFQDLLVKKQANITINDIIRRRNPTFSESNIRSLDIERDGRTLQVSLDVEAAPGTLTAEQIDTVQDILSKELKRRVSMQVTVIPVETFVSEPDEDELFTRRFL